MKQLANKDIVRHLGPGSWPCVVDCKIEDQQVELTLHIPLDLVEFEGHFPQQAVVPGIMQVHWAVKLAQVCFEGSTNKVPDAASFTAMQGLKFNAMVLPDTNVNLNLNFSAESQRLKFAFYDAEKKYSSGDLQFADHRS